MKVLSLAWKYHPSITSGVGVACEGLNSALSKIVDLTVIYPKVSKPKVNNELVLSSDDLNDEQKFQLVKEYTALLEDGKIELAVRLDPYFTSAQTKQIHHFSIKEKEEQIQVTHRKKETTAKETTAKEIAEKLPFDEVDVFGEYVKDKIFLYNRLVEELAVNLEFDVIHAHDWMTFLAGIALKNKFNKPLVLHVQSLEYDRVGHKNSSWVYSIERFAMSKADKVISTSEYTLGMIESNYGLSANGIQTIHNAITIPEFEIKKRVKSNQVFKILFAGRIDGNKGLEYFIEIANYVRKRVKNIEFVVVGRGRGDVRFEEIEGFDEIKSSLRYLGFVEREELFNLYNECDVLCMPSISEPFGLTAIEAAYVGLPVVLSSKTGASEVLPRTPKADFWDTAMFAKHIISLKQNSKLRDRVISDNLEDTSKLSWEASASQVLELYEDLLNG
jgi:glycogen(starch) synthase